MGVNQTGELWLKEPALSKGYFRKEEATNETINLEGWLKTGDLCYIDDDGFLFVVDRLKELIKYKGYQVPPPELEALRSSHSCIQTFLMQLLFRFRIKKQDNIRWLT